MPIGFFQRPLVKNSSITEPFYLQCGVAHRSAHSADVYIAKRLGASNQKNTYFYGFYAN